MRLSWKAGQTAGQISHALECDIRRLARDRAVSQGREFADEADVKWAYKDLVIRIASYHMKPMQTDQDLT